MTASPNMKLYAPFDVVFTRYDIVEPDLLYMSHTRAQAVLTSANVRGVPELDVIRVYARDGDRFRRARELSLDAGDVLTSPLCPGLELRLEDVFQEPPPHNR